MPGADIKSLAHHYLFYPSAMAIVAFVLLMATAGHYGPFTDELYFIACAVHTDFGYVDHPPLVAWLTRLNMMLGHSLEILRLFPALAFSATVLAMAYIVRALGGSRFSAALASVSILCGCVFWVMFGYVSMNAYDILLVTLASYLIIRVLAEGSARLWIALGITIGLGLNAKMTMLVFSFSLFLGFLITDRRRMLLTRYPWFAVLLASALFVPHLLWQMMNHWPTLEFIKHASEKNLALPVFSFFRQLIASVNPLLFPLWATGMIALCWQKRFRPILALAIAVLVFFVIYLMNHAKFYYVLPVIPLLISAGCVALEQWRLMRTRWLRSLLVVLIVGSGVLVLPLGLPVLPIDSFVTYARALGFDQSIQTEHNESKLIPGYFGQRIGWRAFAQTVAAAYHALPDSDRARCGILGFHYGESAAIDYFGPEFKLPNAIGRHNSYWLWGPGSATGEVLLVMLSGTARVEPYFRHVELVASYEFPYIDGPFRQHKIFLCRHAVKPLAQMWPQFKTFD